MSNGELFYWPHVSASPRKPRAASLGLWMNRMAEGLMEAGNMTYDEMVREGFTVEWTPAVWQHCSDCVSSGGVCGFDNHAQASLSFFPGSSINNAIVVATVLGVMGFLLISAGLIYGEQKQGSTKKHTGHRNLSPRLQVVSPKKSYSYADLKLITKSFRTKLWEGGYGSVFRGQLKDSRQLAVKILSKSKENGAGIMNEVASIGRTSHVNIVSLLGFCVDGCRRALVYEFMAKGSLEKYIYSGEPKTFLSWDKLFQVAIGVARGLEYLHRGCSTRIVHFNIKPHNILLDADFCPKISDFGLAKPCSHKEIRLSMASARGTIGYIAPEVFSHLDRDEDLQACDVLPETKGIAMKMILVGLWCIQATPANRPSMSRVVEMLEGNVGDVEMPPKPYISSPVRSFVGSPVQSFVESSSTH